MKKILGILLMLFTVLLIAMFWNLLSFQLMPIFATEKAWRNDFAVIAHRGFSGEYPENTLVSFQKAIELGVDYVELDVHFSQDRQLVVIHDALLNRTTNGQGAVADQTLAQLQQLDAGSWFAPEFAAETLPTLGQVLALASGKTKLLIELKTDQNNLPYEGLAQAVADTLRRFGVAEWCVVQSFEPSYLSEFAQIAPELKRHQLILGELWPLPIIRDSHWRGGRLAQYSAQAVNPFYRTLSAERVNRMHKHGFQVFTYTVNLLEHQHAVINMGVDGIITDHPDVLLELRSKVKK